jgi:cobalamin synthase
MIESVPAAIVVETLAPYSGGPRALERVPVGGLPEAWFGIVLEGVAVGASVQNMWLAATALGLVGTFVADLAVAATAVRAILGVEGDILGALVLGYSGAGADRSMNAPVFPDTTRALWHGSGSATGR